MSLWFYNDGGRGAAGYRGDAGDCVTRALAIAAEMPYQQAYDLVNSACVGEALGAKYRGKSSARTGVHKPTRKALLASLGWKWTATMGFGTGCRVHLRADELPPGRLIVAVSKHLVAVIDGVIHDTYDPSRGGTRCVYGYYSRA